MGYFYDQPPSSTPGWVMPTFAGIMCVSVGLWLVAYILMAQRSLATNATSTPLIILGLNLAWEAVFAFYVADGPLDRVGFACWFLVDIPLVWSTLRTIPKSFESQPLVRRHANLILAASFLFGLLSFGWYSVDWLASPGMGYGDKAGKGWKGLSQRDTTELSFWTATPLQLGGSVGSVAMVLQRGHSGGHGYAIWACRFLGSLLGIPVACTFLWWWWPEATGFITDPFAVIMMVGIVLCDLVYPFVLAAVRKTEVRLDDGTLVAGWSPEARAKKRV